MKFNKEVTGKQSLITPAVIFRKIENTGDFDRYQGSFNKPGKRLINETVEKQGGLKILFSDEHSNIGFTRTTKEGTKLVFGATQLFNSLGLVVGKKYELTVTETSEHGALLTIDADQHKLINRVRG